MEGIIKKIEQGKRIYKFNKNINYFHDIYNVYGKKAISLDKLKELFFKKTEHIRKEDVFDLYIHIPYCPSLCNYCMYSSKQLKNKNNLEIYVDFLIKEIKSLKIFFQKIKVRCLYVGGGSPNILSFSQLKRLFETINQTINFQQGYFEKTFEINPCLGSKQKINLLKRKGINRISFGIQSFNEKTLKKENRTYIKPKTMKKLSQILHKENFNQTNADLIIGLNDEKIENIIYSINESIQLNLDTIHLYTLQFKNEKSRLFTNKKEFDKKIENIFERINEHMIGKNYYLNFDKNKKEIGGTLVKKQHIKQLENYELKKNNIIGIGYGAQGRINGLIEYTIPIENNINSKFKNKYALYKKITKKQEMINFIFNSLQEGTIKPLLFQKKYKNEIHEIFKDELYYLIENNILTKNYKEEYVWKTQELKEKLVYSSIFYDLDFLKKRR